MGALACVVGLLLCACGDSGSSSPGAQTEPSDPVASSASTAATDPTTAPPESPSPTATATGPAPATGKAMTEARITMNAPAGWKITKGGFNKFATSALESSNSITVYDFPESSPSTLDQEARSALRDSTDPKVKRVDNVVVGGVEFYQLSNGGQGFPYVEVGTFHNGGDISIQFLLSPTTLSARERQEIIDSVLASVVLL